MDKMFESFMRDNYKRFYTFCVSRRDCYGDADDIVSEAFIRLYGKWPELFMYPDEYLRKWMYSAISLIIKEYERADLKHDTVNLDDYADTLAVENDAEKAYRYSDLIDLLEEDMNQADREVFRLAFVEGLQPKEICGRLGMNDQMLRTRVSRLKRQLKRMIMKKVYPTYSSSRLSLMYNI